MTKLIAATVLAVVLAAPAANARSMVQMAQQIHFINECAKPLKPHAVTMACRKSFGVGTIRHRR